jgi:hypothetical protein
MSKKILFNKMFSCDDVAEIKDILVVFSPTFGKSRIAGEELSTPLVFKKGEIVNVDLRISIET